MQSDSYNLQRFVDAQESVVDTVSQELGAGQKRSHWMWYVFPQIKGLGHSSTAQHYAIGSAGEARAYLEHPVLGPRLERWTQIVLDVQGRTVQDIFGYPDYLKFHSCMTLFSTVDPSCRIYRLALEKYYGGKPDEATLGILGA